MTRLRTKATRLFLRRVKNAEVWITETGGDRAPPAVQVQRGPRRARGRATCSRWPTGSRASTRLYLYNWRYDGNSRWDSGLISEGGTARMGYYEFLVGLTLDRFKPLP